MTTIADTFNRADSTTTVNPASDSGSWTVVGATAVLGIIGNAGRVVTVGGSGLFGGGWGGATRNTGLTDVDMTITSFRSSAAGGSAFVFGYDQASRTGYLIQRTSSFYQLRSINGDSNAVLGTLVGATDGVTDIVRITRSAGTGVISLYLNSTFQNSITDTTYLSGTSVGWGASVNYAFDGGTFDDFSAVSAPAPPYTPARIAVHARAVARASVI